jgi:hypothetical protein
LKVLQNRISYAAFILRAQKSLYHRVEWLHIMIELSKIKRRTKILRAARKKELFTHKRFSIRLMFSFQQK